MDEERSFRNRSSVRVFKTLLIVVGLTYAFGFVMSLFTFPQIWGPLFHPERPSTLIMNLCLFLDHTFTCLLYVLIIFQLFRLLGLIKKGEPFNQESPKRIRRIAYYIFAMAAVNSVLDSVRTIVMHGFPFPSFWPSLTSFLLRGTQMVLLGIGILIIAFVLEVGVRLQQDQNLTV
jgi:hypothetical protein